MIFQDRAKNPDDRLTSTTTLTVMVKDEDDQDPSFNYQGCTLQDGACVNPEYYTTVSIRPVTFVHCGTYTAVKLLTRIT